MVTDTIKAALWEEVRFAKRQQWTIAAAAVALIAGAYNIVSKEDDWEKAVITILIGAAVIGGMYWLFELQRHLQRTRLVIDPCDTEAKHRGLDIVYGMVGAMILSAIVVCYLLLRDGSYQMLLMIGVAFAMLPMGL
jgi:uncharacterized membrane protein